MAGLASPLEKPEAYPSILVAAEEDVRKVLLSRLEPDGYLVFEAENEAEALQIVIGQSRPIHILLADVRMNGQNLAAALEPYRPEMVAVFVTALPDAISNILDPDKAAAKVRELLKAPRGAAAGTATNRRANGKFLGMTA
jgi:CheY-like chemotaxis protein